MGGKSKSSKEDVNVSSAESDVSSGDDEPEYVVERVVDKRIVKGKVSRDFIFVLSKWNKMQGNFKISLKYHQNNSIFIKNVAILFQNRSNI